MPQHRIITDALDFIQTRFNTIWVSTEADEPTITLPLCSRSMFTALSPSIVDSLFLTVDRIQFFCDFCPTYEYTTALRFREFDRSRSLEMFRGTLSRELFVKLSKPLRFLKTVRFQVSRGLLIAPEIGDELVKRLFLAPGLLLSFSFRAYTTAAMKVEEILPEGIVYECVTVGHLQLLCALLFHNKEDVREHAAYCIGHILNSPYIAQDRRVLHGFQAAVMTYSPPPSIEAAAAKEEDATALKSQHRDCILKRLFALLDRPCRNESAWINYIYCARMLYFRNTDINFETHIKPYIPTLRYLLTAASDRLPEEIAFLFSDLLERRDEAWLAKFLESGIFEMMVDMLRQIAQELDRNDENTKTTDTDDDDNNTSKESTPSPLPSYFYPMVRVLGNFTETSHEMSLKVLEYNFFELIKPRLVVSDKRNTPLLRKELCWACSNFVAWFKLEFLDAGLLPLILNNAFDVDNPIVQREACFCLANFLCFNPDQQQLKYRCYEAVFSEADRFVQAMKLFFMTNYSVTFLQPVESSRSSKGKNNDSNLITTSAAVPPTRSWGASDYDCGNRCLDTLRMSLGTELRMSQIFCQKILVILHQARKKKLQRHDHGSSGAAPSLRLCFEELPDLVSKESNARAVAKIFPLGHEEQIGDNNNTDSDDKDDAQHKNDGNLFQRPGLSTEEKDLIVEYLLSMKEASSPTKDDDADDFGHNNEEIQIQDEIAKHYLSDDEVIGLKTWQVLIHDPEGGQKDIGSLSFARAEWERLSKPLKPLRRKEAKQLRDKLLRLFAECEEKIKQDPEHKSALWLAKNHKFNPPEDQVMADFKTRIEVMACIVIMEKSILHNDNTNPDDDDDDDDEEEEEQQNNNNDYDDVDDDDNQEECNDSNNRTKINNYKIARPEPTFFHAMRRAKIDVSTIKLLENSLGGAVATASENLKRSVSFFDHNIYAEKILDV